jgi:hypothetical protein
MLAVSDDGELYRVRERTLDAASKDGYLWSRWLAMHGVEIETWLIPASLWHIRVHRIRTDRSIWTAEGSFALERTGDDPIGRSGDHSTGIGLAFARYPAGGTGIIDLNGEREGQVLRLDPNTNLLTPRTVLPTLVAQLEPGDHWLTCAVLADPSVATWDALWQPVPRLPGFIQDMILSA